MSAHVHCVPCQWGLHAECAVGQTIPGVLGGWHCVCDHSADTDERLAEARRNGGGIPAALQELTDKNKRRGADR